MVSWVPPIMLAIEPTIIIIVWAYSPISFKCMSFWYPILELHQITNLSNIGLWLRKVTKLGTSTANCWGGNNLINFFVSCLNVTKNEWHHIQLHIQEQRVYQISSWFFRLYKHKIKILCLWVDWLHPITNSSRWDDSPLPWLVLLSSH